MHNWTVLENARIGMRYAWRDPQLDDGVLRADFWLAPGKAGALDHINPTFAEHCTVVSGTAEFRLGDRRWRAGAGDRAALPPGVPHNFRNVGSDEHEHSRAKRRDFCNAPSKRASHCSQPTRPRFVEGVAQRGVVRAD
jgi:Cupin domain